MSVKTADTGRLRIILALDNMPVSNALRHVDKLSRHIGGVKIGLGMMNRVLGDHETGEFAHLLENIKDLRLKLMWDAKLHDIPETVADAVRNIQRHDPWGITIHASGGNQMIRRAVDSMDDGTIAIGVTALTSLSGDEIRWIYGHEHFEAIYAMAHRAVNNGAQAIVCSATDLYGLTEYRFFDKTLFIVPGIREVGAEKHDQSRVDTAGNAVISGATHLVIGRGILQPTSGTPVQAAKRFAFEIEQAEEHLSLRQ